MAETGRVQPRWGRALGAVLVGVVLIAIIRGAWVVVGLSVVIALLAGGYMLHRRGRRRTVHSDHGG